MLARCRLGHVFILTGSVSGVYVGVDGYARGWVAVALDERGGFADAWVAGTLEQLLEGVEAGLAVGVDIPLGLLDKGWRTADRATAQRLGPRRASVFAVPPRPVWSATSLAEANQLCRRLCDGGGFSVQAWGLRTKVLEADAYRQPGRHELIEVHPELAFAGLAGAAIWPIRRSPGTGRTSVGAYSPPPACASPTGWTGPVVCRSMTSSTRPQWRGVRADVRSVAVCAYRSRPTNSTRGDPSSSMDRGGHRNEPPAGRMSR
jgi:hypothetical protein